MVERAGRYLLLEDRAVARHEHEPYATSVMGIWTTFTGRPSFALDS